ncbi:MAG TPA: hypothetical protein DEV59_09015 [Proteus sp.]|uniref:hypothetical protein n=1 Tax=Providencia heimbachae TaxID=333962 RepID=UPI000EE49994|nr:hypothetical protein [Providencia heimbachae]QCJ69761.1 hypothetical protein C9446_07795 [Providencia heimbachae]HCH50812.1 hypothetical protein [Proteus sp. (in: enterobacteria)]
MKRLLLGTILCCVSIYAMANDREISTLLSDGSIIQLKGWSVIYEGESHFNLCKLTIDVTYLLASLKYQAVIKKDINRKGYYDQKNWFLLPDRVIRADCNGYGDHIKILGAMIRQN